LRHLGWIRTDLAQQVLVNATPREEALPVVGILLSGILSIAALPQFPGQSQDPQPAINSIQPLAAADLGHALICLVTAAVLGSVLAFRPRRGGGPPRLAHVTQAQIMMAIVGSLVMLIVGASLARAFAIAGTAGLVRYRAKIDDPKDASVMLSCLAVGLASGVGLLYLAAFGTAFIVAVLRILEWREPWPEKIFELKVSSSESGDLKAGLEALLKKERMKFEFRESSEKNMVYIVHVQQGKRVDKLSEAIANIRGGKGEGIAVAWDEKKAAK
jgi:hypothetical protein